MPAPASSYRWTIVALLFFATTINYIDRQALGILAPTLQRELIWSETDYGAIVSWFSLAYGVGLLLMGRALDRVGVRTGFSYAIVLWSLAAMGHALARTVGGFSIARATLGLGEAGNFPGAIKAVAEWFPKKERAFATGIFNAGSNVGAIIAPLVVPWLALTWGWQAAFIVTGLAGLVWLAFWYPMYRRPAEHPRLSADELAYIESDPPETTTKVPWAKLLIFRQTWAFAVVKFLTDAIWWFYLFWFPLFMNDRFQVDLRGIGIPMVTVYLMADVGSVAGGWLSSRLLNIGWTANAARKTAMLVCAILILPVALAPQVANQWIAVLLIGIATAAHQGFSANIFTTTSDMFPKQAVGSVVGIGGFAGAMGGFIMNLGAGWLRENTGNYQIMFIIAAVVYLIALLFMHLLVPKLEPAKID